MHPEVDETMSKLLAADVAVVPAEAAPRRWFYRQADEHFGPVTGPELRAAAQLGFLGHRDGVRCRGDGPWVRADRVRGLFSKVIS